MKKEFNDRTLGYLLITVMYIVAFFTGLILYDLIDGIHILLRVLIMTVSSTFVLFLFSSLISNSSVYDPYWSVFPVVTAFLLYDYGGEAHPLSKLMLVFIFIWGLRLTANWAYTFKGLEYEDWRYTKFRTAHPKLWPIINLFGIHMFPTVVTYLLMLAPIEFFETVNKGTVTNQFNVSSILAILVMAVAIIIEFLADIQSHIHRRRHPKTIINTGLWKVSRHPNYFGEIAFWFGTYLLLISLNTSMWVLFLGPLVNLLMFVFVSIPMMEKRMMKKYPEYLEYQKNTNVLIPLKKKQQ
ncbi:MAG: DUF1295 domain-containing protein [Bacilli bacterium]|nr:DUF1295 domain-containing protein [Bacilli bacterium]